MHERRFFSLFFTKKNPAPMGEEEGRMTAAAREFPM
jgi:hypothetical protein